MTVFVSEGFSSPHEEGGNVIVQYGSAMGCSTHSTFKMILIAFKIYMLISAI